MQIPTKLSLRHPAPSSTSSQAADGLIPVSQSLTVFHKVILANKDAQVDLKAAPAPAPQQPPPSVRDSRAVPSLTGREVLSLVKVGKKN